MIENQFRERQEEIGEEDLDILQQIQGKIATKIAEKWSSKQTANEMQESIEAAMKETYDEVCREKTAKGTTKKKEFIQDNT